MKKFKGSIVAALLIVLALVLVLGGSVVMTYLSYANTKADYMADIKKLDKASQSSLSNYTLKIRDMAQVPEMYVADLKSVIESTFTGRYGKDGVKAVTLFLQEKNINFDSKLYLNLQSVMESGRDEFKRSQDVKTTLCADFEKITTRPWSGFWIDLAGYGQTEKDIIAKACKVVLDAETNEAFETGEAKSIQLRKQ